MSENNGGDVLARGGVRATFRTAGSSVTKEQWDRMWAEDTDEPKDGSRSSDTEAPGNVSPESGKAQSDKTSQWSGC